jgi:hypothetical protein
VLAQQVGEHFWSCGEAMRLLRLIANPLCGSANILSQLKADRYVVKLHFWDHMLSDAIRHLLEQTGKVSRSVQIEVFKIQIVARHSGSHRTVTMDWIELLAELTTSLAERVFGNGVPELVLSPSRPKADFAADDAGFINVLRYHMLDGVPQFEGNLE